MIIGDYKMELLLVLLFFFILLFAGIFILVKIARSLYLDYKLSILREVINIKLSSINARSPTYREDMRAIVEYVNIECDKLDGLGTDLCKNKNQIEQRLKICDTKIGVFDISF